jgi:hypothetical protein
LADDRTGGTIFSELHAPEKADIVAPMSSMTFTVALLLSSLLLSSGLLARLLLRPARR